MGINARKQAARKREAAKRAAGSTPASPARSEAVADSASPAPDATSPTSGRRARAGTTRDRLRQRFRQVQKLKEELQGLRAQNENERERDRLKIKDLRSDIAHGAEIAKGKTEELRLAKRRAQKLRRRLAGLADAAASLEDRLAAASMAAGGRFEAELEEDEEGDAADEEESDDSSDADDDSGDSTAGDEPELQPSDGIDEVLRADRQSRARKAARKSVIRRVCGRYKRRRRRSLGSSGDSPATFKKKQYNRQQQELHRKRGHLNQFFSLHFGDDWEARLTSARARAATDDQHACNADLWDDTTPVHVLSKFLSEHPELFQDVLDQRKVGQQVEMAAMERLRQHWEVQALKVLTHCKLSTAAYQYLVNLLSNVWVDDDFLRLKLPCGTDMCLFPSKRFVFAQQDGVMKEMGLAADSVSANVDVKAALLLRLKYLWGQGLLNRDSEEIKVQVLIDATGIFPSKRINGTLVVLKPIYDDKNTVREGDQVNSPHNCVICCFYLRDDCLSFLNEHAIRARDGILDLMQNGLDYQGKHYKLVMPLGGDQKLLNGIMNLCGCSAECPCVYCETTTADLHLTKAEWANKGGIKLRDVQRLSRLAHIPEDDEYTCPSPHCTVKTIKPDYVPTIPLDELTTTARRKIQRDHFGVVPYRRMWLQVDDILDLIVDTLHNVLRVVPVIYRQTIAANVDKEGLEKIAQWIYDKLKVIVSSDVALQTPTGTKKLNMSSETWPGSVCWELLTHHEEILKLALPRWAADQKNLYEKCLDLWQKFLYFVLLINEGCEDDDDSTARDAYGDRLDEWGAKVVKAYLPLAAITKKQSTTIYLHICACHVGDLARKWGSLTKYCSQAVEAAHQWVHFFNKFGPRNEHTASVALKKGLSRQHVEMHHPAGRGKAKKREGGTGHMSKAKKLKLSTVKVEARGKFEKQ